MTKSLVATELDNSIDTIIATSNTVLPLQSGYFLTTNVCAVIGSIVPVIRRIRVGL